MTEEIAIPRSFPRGTEVTGKRVVITGAGRGLGRLLAHAFATAGADVALVARTEADLKTVADDLPGRTLVFSGDVTDAEFNEAVADAMAREWGGVDVWVCNAGISPVVGGPRETDPAVWRDILEVNLTGAFLGARAASPRGATASSSASNTSAPRTARRCARSSPSTDGEPARPSRRGSSRTGTTLRGAS